MEQEFQKSALRWCVFAGDPGNSVVRYFDSVDGVLGFCGRLLYGNMLFDILLLSIRSEQPDIPESISDGLNSNLKPETEWVMTIWNKDGKRERQLNSTHDMFAMIHAELRLGSLFIDVRHISNVAPSD